MRTVALVACLGLLAGCTATEGPDAPLPPKGPGPQQPGPLEPAPREIPQNAFTGLGAGCSNLIAYRSSADATQFAVVNVDRALLGLAVGATRTVDLGTEPDGVEVSVDVYGSPVEGAMPYCKGDGEPPVHTRWLAEAGTMTITLRAEPDASTYRASIRLERVHFVGPEGGFAVVVPSIVIDDVRVGWSPD